MSTLRSGYQYRVEWHSQLPLSAHMCEYLNSLFSVCRGLTSVRSIITHLVCILVPD